MKRSRWNNLLNKVIYFQYKGAKPLQKEIIISSEFPNFDDSDEQKIAEELISAHREIVQGNIEKDIRAAELIAANEALVVQNEENERVTNKLFIVQNELIEAEAVIQAHENGLEQIIFITSHKIRQPIANILGIASILDKFLKAPATMKKMVGYIKESSLSLNSFTKELTALVSNLKKKK